jgi:hypothetical protein
MKTVTTIRFHQGNRYIKAYRLDGADCTGHQYRNAFAFYDKQNKVWLGAYSWLKPSRVETPKDIADYLNNLLSEDCEFKQQHNPHEWYCKTHNVLKVAGTEEPVTCQ